MKEKQKTELQFEEALATEITEDFYSRQSARRETEAKWKLNLDFLSGKQYALISATGDVVEDEGGYYWQSRNVYNHILPVLDTRLAKLARVRPVMSVRAVSDDDGDIYTAQLSSRVLNATCARLDMDGIISAATRWSEVAGTVFYYVGWNGKGGQYLGEVNGKRVHGGDVAVKVVSPFEIFPDNLSTESIDDCASVIRARILPVKEIKRLYGKDVSPEASFARGSSINLSEIPSAMLIERYERPCEEFPRGRVVTVAGGRVLKVSELPYINGAEGNRGYPFVKQVSNALPGCFFGTGIIERLIPVQRAYNAVRNRKHEYLSRISMGVMAVEDGSVDTDALLEEGLQPGKVIVYRQGSEPPRMMDAESLPNDFEKEEEKLLDEFVLLGGVNEVSQNYKATIGVTSAAGLQLLLEQDDERLTVSAENIRRSVKEVARQIIRLYKQFAIGPRLMRIAGEGGSAEVFYFTSQDITSDDVVFETENELSYSPSQRRNNILEIIASGILSDENGKINRATKVKLLELMGFGGIENGKTADAMHTARAEEENITAHKKQPRVESYDDHPIHIVEHTRFLVGKGYTRFENAEKVKALIEEHLAEHKKLQAEALLKVSGSVDGEQITAEVPQNA